MASQCHRWFNEVRTDHKSIVSQVDLRDTRNHAKPTTSSSQGTRGALTAGQTKWSKRVIDPVLLTAGELEKLGSEPQVESENHMKTPPNSPIAQGVGEVTHDRDGSNTLDIPSRESDESVDPLLLDNNHGIKALLEQNKMYTDAPPHAGPSYGSPMWKFPPADVLQMGWSAFEQRMPPYDASKGVHTLSGLRESQRLVGDNPPSTSAHAHDQNPSYLNEWSRNPFYSRTNSPLPHPYPYDDTWAIAAGPIAGPSNVASHVAVASSSNTASRKGKRKADEYIERPSVKKRAKVEADDGYNSHKPRTRRKADKHGQRVHYCMWSDEHGGICEAHCPDEGTARKHVRTHCNELFSQLKNIAEACCLWPKCGNTYTRGSMVNHILTHFGHKLTCPGCGEDFCGRKDALNRHMKDFCKGKGGGHRSLTSA